MAVEPVPSRRLARGIKNRRAAGLGVSVDDRARALEDLYRDRQAAFRNGLAPMAGSYELADDLVQEAFACALRKRRSYRGEGTLEAWVWRIAIRLALRAQRKGRREVAVDRALEPSGLPAPERDPELAAALRALPPRRRLFVFLRYFADLSYAEIAEVCGVSEGTVAAALAQAREALLVALEQEGVRR